MSRLEDDIKSKNTQLLYAMAEKQDAENKFTAEQEKSQKLQLDYDTLDRDVQDLFKIEKRFNQMKSKQLDLLSTLSKREMKLAELKPRIY